MTSSALNGGLNKVAKLDTTVTVLDGFRFFEEFETIQLLHERFQSEVETPEDQRTVSDLMMYGPFIVKSESTRKTDIFVVIRSNLPML